MFPPWFVLVMPLQGFPVDGFTVVREKEDGSSRATCSKSLKESLVQVKA